MYVWTFLDGYIFTSYTVSNPNHTHTHARTHARTRTRTRTRARARAHTHTHTHKVNENTKFIEILIFHFGTLGIRIKTKLQSDMNIVNFFSKNLTSTNKSSHCIEPIINESNELTNRLVVQVYLKEKYKELLV
jgi:hypothetical protein